VTASLFNNSAVPAATIPKALTLSSSSISHVANFSPTAYFKIIAQVRPQFTALSENRRIVL
jgi:hypothetical protein